MCNDDMYLFLAWSLLKLNLQFSYFFEEVITIPRNVVICIFLSPGSASQLILSSLCCVMLHGEQSLIETNLAVPGAVHSRPSDP